MKHQDHLATGLTASREVHSGNTATISDCIAESFTTTDMFEVSAHAGFHNKANISVHQFTVIKVLLPKFAVPIQTRWQCLQICCTAMIPQHFVRVSAITQAEGFSISVLHLTDELQMLGGQVENYKLAVKCGWHLASHKTHVTTQHNNKGKISVSQLLYEHTGSTDVRRNSCELLNPWVWTHQWAVCGLIRGGDLLAVHFPVGHFLEERSKYEDRCWTADWGLRIILMFVQIICVSCFFYIVSFDVSINMHIISISEYKRRFSPLQEAFCNSFIQQPNFNDYILAG